jgi:hypothetical protein
MGGQHGAFKEDVDTFKRCDQRHAACSVSRLQLWGHIEFQGTVQWQCQEFKGSRVEGVSMGRHAFCHPARVDLSVKRSDITMGKGEEDS